METLDMLWLIAKVTFGIGFGLILCVISVKMLLFLMFPEERRIKNKDIPDESILHHIKHKPDHTYNYEPDDDGNPFRQELTVQRLKNGIRYSHNDNKTIDEMKNGAPKPPFEGAHPDREFISGDKDDDDYGAW